MGTGRSLSRTPDFSLAGMSSSNIEDGPIESRIELGRAIGAVVKWDKERGTSRENDSIFTNIIRNYDFFTITLVEKRYQKDRIQKGLRL